MLEIQRNHIQQTPHPDGRIHIIGAGPVGLMLTSMLQSADGPPVRLYERRREYTRTRMVSLAPYLVADSIEAYEADSVDEESVEAIFERADLEAALAYRQTMPPLAFQSAQGMDAWILPAECDRTGVEHADRFKSAQQCGAS